MSPCPAATTRHATRRPAADHHATPRPAAGRHVPPAWQQSVRHRDIRGSRALAYGLAAAAYRAGLPLFLGAHPAAPTTAVLGTLARLGSHGVRYFEAEDEIAAAGAALGASFAGLLGVTVTSGQGMMLKAETIGLASILELPLLIVNVQRGGPSAGLTSGTGQADLMQAVHGRSGETPLPVIAAQSPADCFGAAIEACQLALAYRTPAVLLADEWLTSGCERWQVPATDSLPDLRPAPGGASQPAGNGPAARQHKIDSIAVPDLVVDDPGGQAKMLVIGWGSTQRPIAAACQAIRGRGGAIARAHLRHLCPLPANLLSVLACYDAVLVPELNLGQLAMLIRAHCAVDTIGYTQTRGEQFTVAELERVFLNTLTGTGTW